MKSYFINLPLPDPDTFVDDQFNNVAFPEILAYSAALIGISLTVMLVKSFMGK